MKNNMKIGLSGLALVASTLPSLAAEGPATFATPQDAFEAFSAALGDRDAVLEVFGTDAIDVLMSGDAQEDAENRAEIEAMIQEGYRFQLDEENRVMLLLGAEAWPFPIPLAKTDTAWAFDIEAGRDEVFYRRIGLNELETIDMIEAYVELQSAYRLIDHDADGVMEFAASILSSDGARDGLVWAGEDSPLGERIALASLDGFSDGESDQEAEPFGGYYYRVLQGQGASAPGGALDYIVGGNMIAGHALLAVPATYNETGIHSFIVSENGRVLAADLGENSLDVALEILTYNPDTAWSPVE
ncbi:DUF2950 family protein [Falsihalocynthiibacter arcticus]|uniref:DUF2950 domain-containing protein n=1 Tax=Falsihalocynthiibacter arcticus TaxID=1579316 RepID=A0A126V566_9RHOB|nr:DUF2950 family protein [Falsihalocynthiibacter arcticus]AML53115.1 hypothetical protein RC74_19295 [Falsihalocynthiibacter arcticus]